VGKKEKTAYWLAYWTDDTDRKRMKKFSITVYGELAARALAVETRNMKVESVIQRFKELVMRHRELELILRNQNVPPIVSRDNVAEGI
jgi:hypothetical protein